MSGVTLHPVESSMMSHVGYDEDNKILSILFHSGKRYEYDGVPKTVFLGLLAADSKGAYFNENIDGTYGYRLESKRRR